MSCICTFPHFLPVTVVLITTAISLIKGDANATLTNTQLVRSSWSTLLFTTLPATASTVIDNKKTQNSETTTVASSWTISAVNLSPMLQKTNSFNLQSSLSWAHSSSIAYSTIANSRPNTAYLISATSNHRISATKAESSLLSSQDLGTSARSYSNSDAVTYTSKFAKLASTSASTQSMSLIQPITSTMAVFSKGISTKLTASKTESATSYTLHSGSRFQMSTLSFSSSESATSYSLLTLGHSVPSTVLITSLHPSISTTVLSSDFATSSKKSASAISSATSPLAQRTSSLLLDLSNKRSPSYFRSAMIFTSLVHSYDASSTTYKSANSKDSSVSVVTRISSSYTYIQSKQIASSRSITAGFLTSIYSDSPSPTQYLNSSYSGPTAISVGVNTSQMFPTSNRVSLSSSLSFSKSLYGSLSSSWSSSTTPHGSLSSSLSSSKSLYGSLSSSWSSSKSPYGSLSSSWSSSKSPYNSLSSSWSSSKYPYGSLSSSWSSSQSPFGSLSSSWSSSKNAYASLSSRYPVSSAVVVPSSGKENDKETGSNTIIFAAAGGGGGLLLMIFIICIILASKRRSRRKRYDSIKKAEDQDKKEGKIDWTIKWSTMRENDVFNKRKTIMQMGVYGEENDAFVLEEKKDKDTAIMDLSRNSAHEETDVDDNGNDSQLVRCRTFSSSGTISHTLNSNRSLIDIVNERRKSQDFGAKIAEEEETPILNGKASFGSNREDRPESLTTFGGKGNRSLQGFGNNDLVDEGTTFSSFANKNASSAAAIENRQTPNGVETSLCKGEESSPTPDNAKEAADVSCKTSPKPNDERELMKNSPEKVQESDAENRLPEYYC